MTYTCWDRPWLRFGERWFIAGELGGICVLDVVVMMLRLGHVMCGIISKVYNIVVLCSYADMQVSGYQ